MTGDTPTPGRHRSDQHNRRHHGWWWALTRAPRRRLFDPASNPLRTGLGSLVVMSVLLGEGCNELFSHAAWFIRLRGLGMALGGLVILFLLVAYLSRPATVPPEPPLWKVVRQGARTVRRRDGAGSAASKTEPVGGGPSGGD